MDDKRELQALRRRVQLDPGDFGAHYQLGVVLARTGAHEEAITEFQKSAAGTSAELKVQAFYRAGLSLEATNALELADRSYREALELLEPEDCENLRAMHYRLGRIAEALGNDEAAEEHYIAVASIDYADTGSH
jgi:tetratricopeptide (TPR) repeat protein